MSWTNPRTWRVGEIVTKAIMDLHVKDNLRYLKGLDGVPTIQSGLIIDNTDGDEYLKLPLLSTAEAATVLNVAGEVAYDEATNRIKMYGTTLNSVVTTADVDDVPVDAAATDPISSNWAYDFQQTLTAAGDIPYATAAGVWDNLPVGTIGHILSVAAGGAAPEWRAETARTNKLDNETRDFTAASGDVSYTGYGFQPTSLIVIAYGIDNSISVGLGDVNLSEACIYIDDNSGAYTHGGTSQIIHMLLSGGATGQTAVLKTLDADGFTLTWTEVGTPGAGTISFAVLASR